MIALYPQSSLGTCDIAIEGGTVTEAADITTAVLVSLYTDRHVIGHEVPPGAGRGGWWGGAYPVEGGDQEGSRLWLLQVVRTGRDETLRRAESYATEALQWLIDEGLARAVTATAEWWTDDALLITVTIAQDEGAVRVELEVAA